MSGYVEESFRMGTAELAAKQYVLRMLNRDFDKEKTNN